MKANFLLQITCVAILAGGVGCGSSDPISSSATNFQAAFKKTESHVKEFAEQAVTAERQNDFTTAFVHYRALSLNPDLSQDQRNMANESMLAMSQKLREAAEKGDQQAQQVLENYRATK